MRIRLNLAYDGTCYKGWQFQPEVPTIQGTLEKALAKLFDEQEIRITGSGRTDTGVHAAGQVAHADVPPKRIIKDIKHALNAILPDDITVLSVKEVDSNFHSRFDACERTYIYRILDQPDIFQYRFAWLPPFSFDADKVENIAGSLTGKHDFRRYSVKMDTDYNTVCEIKYIRFAKINGVWQLEICADRFLRRMVRIIVGTLLEVSAGRLDQARIVALLEGSDARTGTPAPPQGLALLRVQYESDDSVDKTHFTIWRNIL